MPRKIDVSVLIVNYRVQEELLRCIKSIYDNTKDLNFEIIVVDNDEVKTLSQPLSKKFPRARYVASEKNVGWGGGINIAASFAKGEYLYLLNPDTILSKEALNVVYEVAKSNKNFGVVASRLVDLKMKPYDPLGSKVLTPFRALVTYTFLERYFPFSVAAKNFFRGRVVDNQTFLDIAPLTASLIKRSVFSQLKGFDKKMFLYFEEYEFGKRLKDKGYTSLICDQSIVVHAVGSSTKKRNDSNSFFIKSRRYYFTKHYGRLWSGMLEKIFMLKVS